MSAETLYIVTIDGKRSILVSTKS